MPSDGVWWDGERLSQGEIALAVFTRQPQPESLNRVPVLGAASSGAHGVVLLPTQLSRFLRQHHDATIICYDAAEWHWLLEGHLRGFNDAESLRVLWAYSREARLIDIMLLDQHVRRCQGEGGAVASPLHRLLRRWAEVELPDNQEIQHRIAAAWKGMSQDPNDPALELALAVAAGILRAYERLMAEAKIIEETVEARQLPPVRMPKSTPVGDAAVEKPDPPSTRTFGPLGVGIDVQAAIALNRPGRRDLQVDPQELEELRQGNDERYHTASARLHADVDARSCIRWTKGSSEGHLVAHDEGGIPRYRRQQFKGWLQATAKKLCDLHSLPADIPITQPGDLSTDPEQWGIWAACNRSLRAWRDLERSAQVDRCLTQTGHLRPAYEVVPLFRSRDPDLVALRSLGRPMFRPQAGHIFLVGRMSLLNLVCLAAAHQQGSRPPRGRLAGHFLGTEDPLGKIAGELRALASGEFDPDAEDSDDAPDVGRSNAPFAEVVARLDEFEKNAPDFYWRVRAMTGVLLEAIPLGLPLGLLTVLLQDEYGWVDVKATEIELLKKLLVEHVVYELQTFLDDDVLSRLTRVLGLTPAGGVNVLAEKEHVDTTDAALRNDLLQKREGSPVWRFICEARESQPMLQLPTDDEIVERVLRRVARTPTGRVIGPAFWTEVRRQQMLLLADETMKSVAYALVAEGFPLVAMADDQFVLEVTEAEATQDQLTRVARIAKDAGRRVLGRFAAPCQCEQAALW